MTIDLYGPLGIRKYVWTCLGLSQSPLVYNLAIHELVPRPDQYPPDYHSWNISNQMDESPLPQESFHELVEESEGGRWSLYRDRMLKVEAAVLRHRIPCWGFVVTERSSPGRLDTVKLTERGILPGPIYGKLKAGQQVTLGTGEILDPRDFLGPDIPGRKLAILGDTCDSRELANIGQDLDLLGEDPVTLSRQVSMRRPTVHSELCEINITISGIHLALFSSRGHYGGQAEGEVH